MAANQVLAQETGAESGVLAEIERAINTVFEPVTRITADIVFAEISVFGMRFPWIVAWLVIAASVFTVYFGFVQFRSFKLSLEIVRGKYTGKDEPGEISHFQALSAAVSGTVGLGNIAGVGVAVTIGGPGATFWMIVAGLLGMCTKFVECTLGVKYREFNPDGSVAGGPMHYLRKGIAERYSGKPGKIVGHTLAACVAATMLVFAFCSAMLQTNQTFAQLRDVTGGSDGLLGGDGAALVTGVVIALVVGSVIIGGIKSIAKVTSRLVPTMAILYVGACLIVIATNITSVPAAFGEIISGAFAPEGVVGGAVGAMVIGFQRAAFSNEAGLGAAATAHSAVRTKHPVTEGYVALLEPFIDTVVICTMTALTIVIAQTQLWESARADVLAGAEPPDGVTVTSQSFDTVLPGFSYVLTIAVVLFAVSTMISWAYYGQQAASYLFGLRRRGQRVFQLMFCAFIVVGAVMTLGAVLDFADAFVFCIALFNIAGLYLLAPVVKREVKAYREKLRSGEVRRLDRTR